MLLLNALKELGAACKTLALISRHVKESCFPDCTYQKLMVGCHYVTLESQEQTGPM